MFFRWQRRSIFHGQDLSGAADEVDDAGVESRGSCDTHSAS
jgi:hypothetical protein